MSVTHINKIGKDTLIRSVEISQTEGKQQRVKEPQKPRIIVDAIDRETNRTVTIPLAEPVSLLTLIGHTIYTLWNAGKKPTSYKQRQRSRSVKVEPDNNYCPAEVAAVLNVSYDSAIRLMQKMKGVFDLGTPTRRYKRGKKKLRISGKNLAAYMQSKTR